VLGVFNNPIIYQFLPCKFPYVTVDRHVRPVLPEYPLTERLNLAEGDRAIMPDRFKAKGKTADSGKEVKDIHSPIPNPIHHAIQVVAVGNAVMF